MTGSVDTMLRMNMWEQQEIKKRNKRRKIRRRRRKLAAILTGTVLISAGGYYCVDRFFATQRTDYYKTEKVLVGVSEIYGHGAASDEEIKNKGELWTAEKEYQVELENSDLLAGINSPNAILLDVEDNRVIAEKNAAEKIHPASMTKMMTAVLALEMIENLDEPVVLYDEDFTGLYEQEASMAGFQPGEEVTYRDLVYGIILPSGAECCLAVANRISGSEAVFVDLMNQKAQEIGMNNTHFSNCTGLDSNGHTSTVEDMAKLLQYAIQNQQFLQILSSTFYSVASTNMHPEGFTFYSTVAGNLDSMQVNGGTILGGKTGYTEEAGLCLASLAQVYDNYYILVTAGAEGMPGYKAAHLTDAVTVYGRIG